MEMEIDMKDFFMYFFTKDSLESFLVIFFTITVIHIIISIFKYRYNQWHIDMWFRNPETGREFLIKSKGDKYRYYVNGFRVPKKFFNWLE